MPQSLQPHPQEQRLLPFFLLRIPIKTMERMTTAKMTATMMVGQFMTALLSKDHLEASVLDTLTVSVSFL